ncbi:MAG: ABC-three component system protein [Faecalispora sporosphaeroides]|uniref:ABC-three component system protein n=1 Tax=Faecalispora sporosphaeroides TaxID=1549 RepID=UPI0039918EEC
MATHDAPGQMAGYLYQVLAALLLILDSKNDLNKLCIEKFDDVAFVETDKPKVMIQVKHQINARGKLTNTSTDLWRSINSWCDSIKTNSMDILTTSFVILTTAVAPDDSAAYFLRGQQKNRNTEKALELILTAANGTQETTKAFRNNFLSLSDEKRRQLISNIYIYDNSIQIKSFREELKRRIRWGTLPRFEDLICEQLEGWWFQKAIQFLCSDQTVYIDQKQVQSKIYEISSSYREDSLPITVDPLTFPSEKDLKAFETDTQVFIEQLKLIVLSEERIKRAIRDYYHAYQQRAKWVREDLLYIDELETYETQLVDEWQRLFEISKEELSDVDSIDENIKRKIGKKLYNDVENLELYIRERVTQPFIMRGTYHGLSNKLQIGWHADFYDRLYKLLKEVPV